MTATKEHPVCPVCTIQPSFSAQDGGLCAACKMIAEAVQDRPETVQRLWMQYHGEPMAGRFKPLAIEGESELPDVLDGKRYRTIDRDRNKWYLSVSEVDGRPVEIFASTAFDRDHELQARIANLTTITRLISLLLRHIFLGEPLTFDKCLKQIQRSSRQKNDLPDMLYGVLSRYRDRTEEPEPTGGNGK
ncbi:MAG: hypothetical protein GXY53_02765 [Desulfobulbus sp.]|nr:hypothetical protein [Desulfobulbus sp.]